MLKTSRKKEFSSVFLWLFEKVDLIGNANTLQHSKPILYKWCYIKFVYINVTLNL